MNLDAFIKLGFAAGLVKAAAGDNQPGPMPQQPAAPDSHRKRNVALGAALLAGGLMGTRHLNRTGTTLATQAMKTQRAGQGRVIVSALKSSNPSVRESAKGVASAWLARNKLPITPTLGQKAQALKGHYKGKANGVVARIKSRMASGAQAQAPAPSGKRPYDVDTNNKTEFWANRDRGARRERLVSHMRGKKRGSLKRKAQFAALGTAATVGGAVAGASGASKANEAQSDDQPGLGRGVG